VDVENIPKRVPHVIYEPAQFPGAIYHAEDLEGASILIFASGKVVLAGLKREDLLEVGKNVLARFAQAIS
jgi:TATA-box binding protein (TBP) (component of TFIID and TFIIIB)